MAKSKDRPTLDEVSIRGLGVIDSASLSFSKGFTAITGETGAGKTMVLTALGLITGAKADSDFVRNDAPRSVVSAIFSVNENIAAKVEEAGGEVDAHCLAISRSVSTEGKSRITLGGTLSTSGKVAEISAELIEIHAQSSSLRLNKPAVQRELLDSFAEIEVFLLPYQSEFENYQILSRRIRELQKESETSEEQILELKRFVEDFSALMPISGELLEIENEINRLGSVEEIHSQLSAALNILENDDGGLLTQLKSAKKALDSLLKKDSSLDAQIEKFSELTFDAEDVVSELLSYLTRLEADPARFDYLQQRKQGIYALIKKYGKGSEREAAFNEILSEYLVAEEKIADLSGGSQRINELKTEREKLFKSLQKHAVELSEFRSKVAKTLSEKITSELSALSMPNASVLVSVKKQDPSEIKNFSLHGIDDIEFEFSPHTGSKLMPLAKIASGGEMSRLMLAIEVVIASQSPVGTYVFDEVDAGVGGKAAVEVGRRLAALSQNAQVIVVTHLPQVAVWADTHLVVRKDQFGSITESSVITLNPEERLKEIARMLAGQEESKTAQKHAEELLQMVKESVIS